MTAENESRPDEISPRLDPRVYDAMLPYLTKRFGNAASLNHSFGWEAQDACGHARAQVAHLLNASAARDIVFTGGGIESNMLAIHGTAAAYADRGMHLVTTSAGRPAVLRAFQTLEHRGYRVTYLPVDRKGRIDPEDVRRAITDRTILLSVALAYDDSGAASPIAELGALTREAGVVFHVDGTQAVGRIPVDVQAMGIDLLSIDGETMAGPRGVGALYVRGRRPRVRLMPLIDGGGQERGWRSGTLNVPGIVGLGAACSLCMQDLRAASNRLRGGASSG